MVGFLSGSSYQRTEASKECDNIDARSESGLTKRELAANSFEAVIAADAHLDEKALRITQVLAFLTVAIGAVYGGVYSLVREAVTIGSGVQLTYFGFHLVDLAFICYVLALAIGVLIYLNALNQPLVLPSNYWRSSDTTSDGTGAGIESLIFFERIGSSMPEKWGTYWRSTDEEDISNLLIENYVGETWLVAKGAYMKYSRLWLGGWFFRLSLCFLILFVAGLSDVGSTEVSALHVAVAGVFAWGITNFIIELRNRYRSSTEKWLYPTLIVVITALISAFLFYC